MSGSQESTVLSTVRSYLPELPDVSPYLPDVSGPVNSFHESVDCTKNELNKIAAETCQGYSRVKNCTIKSYSGILFDMKKNSKSWDISRV